MRFFIFSKNSISFSCPFSAAILNAWLSNLRCVVAVNKDGFINKNTKVSGNDVIIGKIIPVKNNVFLSKNFIGQISLAESADFFTKDQLIDFHLRDVSKFKVSEDVIIKNIKKPNND